MDRSLSGSSVHGILQAKTLEWVVIPFFKGIFPTQRQILGLLHCRWILYQLSHQGSLEQGISSVQFSGSVVSYFATPWIASRQASLSITSYQSLLKLTSVELVMPSNHLILHSPHLPLPSIFPSIRVFSNESVPRIRWPKYWSFSISPFNEYSGLISFRIDWFDLLESKRFSRVFSSTTVQKHQFFGIQLSLWSNSHNHSWLPEKP